MWDFGAPSHPVSHPQDARHAAEEEIYTNLNQKIDQFLQLADYDWLAPEPGSRASDYLVDLIGFLRSTFAVFTHLPVSPCPGTCLLWEASAGKGRSLSWKWGM